MTLELVQPDPSGHFLMTYSGKPFFWLADTAWELFHRLSRVEAEHYLVTREKQGFNVIQAVILAELDGLHTPNVNGDLPLLGDDPTRPNEPYFLFVDEIIRLAAEKGLYIGLLPTWGDKVTSLWGLGPEIFNIENAHVYGKYLGQRYQNDTNILWILGGDRPIMGYELLWQAMAEGIIEGLGYKPFMSFHPVGVGATGSAQFLHNTDWLTMNMWQSGHRLCDIPIWDMITTDYQREPAKPVLDDEPSYEDHPIDPFDRQWRPEFGRYSDYDVRKLAYRAVFSGACGHTYGHHSVWQFWTHDRIPVNFPDLTWREAIQQPGARQMRYLKDLMLSRPYLSRVPDQSMLPDVHTPPPVQDQENDRFNPFRSDHPRATFCKNGRYGMVYFPQSNQNVRVDLSRFSGKVKAWWYDPRNGKAHSTGVYPNKSIVFTTPIAGPDWVLILDNEEENFNEPGTIDSIVTS